jgi:TP901 family phage tail tape measure protein
MADIQSDIKVNIDTSSALASIKNLQRQISAFQSAMAKGSAANSAAAQNLQKDLLQNINATGKFAASMTNVKTTTESFTNSLEKNKFSMGEYFRFAGGASKTFSKFFKGEFETINKVARERVKDLQTQYIQLGRDANGAMRAMKVRPLSLDLEDLGTKTQIAGQRQQLFNQLLKQGSTNLLNWGKNTQWAGRQLMVGFTIPLAVFGSMASKTFMDLEKQAIRFKRVYGDAFSLPADADKAVKEMQELASEFTKYGIAIEKTMELAADAAQMGLTGSALNAQVREATRLAVLGEVEQQEALTATISVTNAFGVAAEDLAKKIDFLNAVENETVTSINDLTIAIPKAGPVVKQLGGDVEDLAFFLTAMKEGGINASEGANALKSGLASLINPTKVSSEFLQKLGINIAGIVEANKGDVKGVVIDFAEALDTLDPLNRARAIEQLFGKFQFSRISTLFQNVIAEGNQAQRVLELANASTSELALLSERELGKVAESTTFKYEKAIQDFRMALAPVGEEFLKAITPIIEFGTSLIKQFNNMDAGVKGFVTNITLLFAGVGPVLLMTVGLLANGIANIIKGAGAISQLFQRLKGGPGGVASEISYMTQEQMEALAVAASLDQVHSKLQQTFTSEKLAIDALTLSYQRAVAAQRAFGLPPTIRAAGSVAPQMYASGTVKVPGPKGAGDVVPAMLSPGEAVIPADQAEKYRGFISSMIAGKVPGFANGVMLGMPRSAKSVSKNRDAADAIYQEFLKSSYANVPPTEYGHQIAPTSGHSFPIFGLGGVYSKAGGGQVFVKPVMDETAALAEIRGTQIARQAHGLEAPEQRIVVIRDPLDSTRQRRFLALESDLDAKFIQNQPKAVFNEEQYFRQLVASLVRVDKDLAAANVFGNVVADVGPAGVFDRASGVRALKTDLPSMEEQALVNLLGIKGGAKRAFAESTLALMASMTPQQYHQYMIAEIQRVLPALRQTVSGFGLSNPSEIDAYDAMIKRLEIGLGVDWGKFHAVHSAVKIAVPKAPKVAPVAGYANGVVSVPGPKGKGDVVPAMLSPGEAVIPAGMAKKYAPLINGMIAGNIPGYVDGLTVPVTQSLLSRFFGDRGNTSLQASHFQSQTPLDMLPTLARDMAVLGDEFEDLQVTVREYTATVDENGKTIYTAKDKVMRLSEVVDRFNNKEMPMVAGGAAFGGTAVLESGVRNQKAYRKMELSMSPREREVLGTLGAPESLEDVETQGRIAARALEKFSGKLTEEVELVLRNIVTEGQNASAALKSSTAAEQNLEYMMAQREKSIKTFLQYGDSNLTGVQKEARLAQVNERLEQIKERYYQETQEGISEQEALSRAQARLRLLTLEQSRLEGNDRLALHVGDVSNTVLKQSATGRIGPTSTSGRETISNWSELDSLKVGRSTNAMVAEAAKEGMLGGAAEGSVRADRAEVLARNAVFQMLDSYSTGITDGTEDFLAIADQELLNSAEVKSPSRKTIRATNAMVDGVTTTIVQARDDVANATKTMVAPVSETPGVFRVPGSRRATTNPELAAMPVGTQTGGPRAPRRATAPQQAAGGPDQTGLMAADGMMLQIGASAGRASTEIDRLGETAKKGGVGLLGYGGMVSNLTFGASALAGVMSSMGGEIGAFGQEIFKVTGVLFAATSVIQAFTQMKVLEIAATRAKIASDVAFGVAIGPKTAAQAATGFGATLARGATFVTAFLGPIGLATIAIGAMVAGIYLVNKAREEEKARIEGLGKVANLAADKIQKLASVFGVSTTPSPIDTATLVPGVSATERVEANAVRESEGFADDYKAELDAIRTGAQKDVELALQFLTVKLSGMGFEPGMIDTIINALLLEAGRTDLQLNFKSIDIGAEGGIDQALQSAREAVAAFEAAAVDGNTGKTEFAPFDKGGQRIVTTEDQKRALEEGGITVQETPIFTEEYLAKLNTLAQGLSGTVSGLSSAFANSTIGVEEFSEGMDGVSDAILGIEDEAARSSAFGSFLEGMRTEQNATFIDGLKKIAPTAEGIADSMLLIKAQAGGLELPPGIAEDFAAVSKGTASPAQIAAVNAMRAKANGILQQELTTQKGINDQVAIKKEMDADISTALTGLREQNAELENSNKAYEFLIDQGYSAADAFTLASNAGYAAAIAASAADPTKWQELNEELKLFLKNSNMWKKKQTTSSGGAPQKGPFEDVLTSLKKIAQRSINVKGGIDEIFKLFGKNRNIKLNRGFESLFVKGNFNASFTKFLAEADAKTRNLLVRFKDGKAVLTDFGKAVEKAFQTNSLAGFRQQLRLSLQSMGDQRAAIKALVANNISYAEAVKIASDAEAASAIATAASKKNKGELLALLKLIRKEQNLQLILQGEQEIADKKQSKIQETKDMLEGVREQIREYNKLSKAQEQLSKSNFTLIEQQAILRDPVLITMYLDGIEPDLLKAKLKQAISPEFMQGIFEEGFNNAMAVFSANEEKLDVELRIKTKDDEGILRKAQKDIAAISFRIDDLEADLTRLEIKEEEISSIYDKRIEALEEIKSINDDLVDQQDKQLTIADALSQGDISAAAKAVQDLRASQAARSIDMQTEALEKSREVELAALRSANGRSRAEIEKIIKDLQMEIFEIEESRLEPAQRRVDLATEEKDELVQSFTVLGRTKLEWDSVASKITSAKVQSDLYKGSIEASIGMVNALATAWSTVKPTNPVIPFPETPKSEAVLAAEAAAAKEAEDAKKDKEEDKKPKPKPKPGSGTSAPAAPQLTQREIIEQADRDYEKRAAEQAQKRDDINYEIKKLEEKIQTLDLTKALLDSDLRKARASLRLDPKNTSIARAVSRLEDRVFANNELDKKQRGPIVLQIAAFQNRLSQLASGGFVSGPGTPTSDSIPALLSDGEYVIKAASVNKFGKGFLDSINAGVLPGFKKGGRVDTSNLAGIAAASVSQQTKNRNAMIADKQNTSKAALQAKSAVTQKAFNQTRDEALAQKERDRLYKKGGFQGFEAGLGSFMVEFSKTALGKFLGDAYSGTGAGNAIFRGAVATLSTPVEVIGSSVKNALEFASKPSVSKALRMVNSAPSIVEGTSNAFAGVLDASKQKPSMFEQAGQSVIDNRMFGAGNKESNALARIIAGSLNIFGDPAAYVGVGALRAGVKTGARAGARSANSSTDSFPLSRAMSPNEAKEILRDTEPKIQRAAVTGDEVMSIFKREFQANNPNQLPLFRPHKNDEVLKTTLSQYSKVWDSMDDTVKSQITKNSNSQKIADKESFLKYIEKSATGFSAVAPDSLDDVSKLNTLINQQYAKTILNLDPKNGTIKFYRNTKGKHDDKVTEGRGYYSLDRHMAYTYAPGNVPGSYHTTGSRVTAKVKPGEFHGLLGTSSSDEFAANINPKLINPKNYNVLGDKRLPKTPSWYSKPETTFGGGNSPYRFFSLLNQVSTPTSIKNFKDLTLKKFLSQNNKTIDDFKALYYKKYPLKEGQQGLFATDFEDVKDLFSTDLKNPSKIGLDIPKLDDLKISQGKKEKYLQFIDIMQELSGQRIFNIRGIPRFAMGGMVKLPKREPAPMQMAFGGMVKPKYFNAGGFAMGTDTIPAMLTPGEFVMSKYAVDSFGADNLKAINNGAYSSDSVYNYSINVNVQTDANANDIARNVMTEIRRIDSQKIRGNRF